MGANDPRNLALAYAAIADARSPKLLIVSDVRLFSEGLTEALGRSPLLSTVDHCANWPEALAKLPACRPDIVLIDASIPDGLGLVYNIRQIAPEVLLVVLALTDTVESVISWVEAGVSGYIPKTAGLADVLPTLLGIQRGEQMCSPSEVAPESWTGS
jgi:DNA-binding NarL/FixJ family response regulator